MSTEKLYLSLYTLLKDTELLIEYICNDPNPAIDIVIPDHIDLPSLPASKLSSILGRFKFKKHEEPYETFSWPGFVYHPDESGELRDLINNANTSRIEFHTSMDEFKNNKRSTLKPILALCEYQRESSLILPIIGSPDRLKARQLTRQIRTFHDASRATFSHDIKNEVTTFDPTALIEQFASSGFADQARELASFKEGELKKVHPPTERWRVNVKYNNPKPIKAHVSIPVFFTGKKPELRGISNGEVPEKKNRCQHPNKKKLIPVVEQYGVYKYE